MKKLMVYAGAVGVAALVLSGCESSGGGTDVAEDCTPASEFETITDGTLTVSVPELPPFTQYGDGEPVGADVDYIAAFAEANCKSVNWMQPQYAGAIPAVTEERADMASGAFYRTEERDAVGLDSFGSAGERLKDNDEYTVETVESDDRVAASVEPAQITFPHTQDNDAMTEALNEWVATAHEDGTIAEILESRGLPAESADTGEPRLIG